MKEDLIQFIWNSATLCSETLYTTDGESIEILKPGILNVNQGPDFLNAQIRIKQVLWIGHVEIHVKASDWLLHQHDDDPNYQNIILHVVWEHDRQMEWKGRKIPGLELKACTDENILQRYQQLMENQQQIPCETFIHEIDPLIKTVQIERMMFERLYDKTERCKSDLSLMQWDWEAMLFRQFAYYLAAPVNSDAMHKLFQLIPFQVISKLQADSIALSALMFGVAGMLQEETGDDYYLHLQKEFAFLKNKFKLECMDFFEWKFLRLRPSYFPGLRIAQWIALFTSHPRIFSEILESKELKQIHALLEVYPQPYWNDHYLFNKKTKNPVHAVPGRQTREILIINAICPVIFSYGSIYQSEHYRNAAISYLQSLKPETNKITQMWKNYKFVFDHAGHSQGGIQLYHAFCTRKKCTSCSIGNEILKSKTHVTVK
jgi:hypothetical protein